MGWPDLRSLAAGCVILFGTACYYHRSIEPLHQQQAKCREQISRLEFQLGKVQDELCAIKEQEQANSRIRQALNALHDDAPVAPVVTWLPARMKSRLGSVGVTQADVRLNVAEREPSLIGFDRTYWHVSVPSQSGMRRMTDALLAVAQLEQQDRFVKILDLSFHGDSESAAGQVNVMAFVRK